MQWKYLAFWNAIVWSVNHFKCYKMTPMKNDQSVSHFTCVRLYLQREKTEHVWNAVWTLDSSSFPQRSIFYAKKLHTSTHDIKNQLHYIQ